MFSKLAELFASQMLSCCPANNIKALSDAEKQLLIVLFLHVGYEYTDWDFGII